MGITWITGNSGAGKTMLAKKMIKKGDIFLDGDELRNVWTDLNMTKTDRRKQNIRVARLANMLDRQGFDVIVAVICPYRDLRTEVKKITKCKFIYIEGGKRSKNFPYEHPELY